MFLLEFNPALVKNIRNQGPKRTAILLGPLNTTNLTRRSVCLESILVCPIFKFHHQIQKNLRSLKLQTLNAKLNLSTKEGSPSTFEIFFSRISSVESRLFLVERSKKDLNMQTHEHKGLLSGEESNILFLNSTRLNKKKDELDTNSKNLGQWARVEIQNQKLKKDNLKNNIWFKGRNRQEKQAIYYQLRKINKSKSKNKVNRGEVNSLSKTLLICESFKASLFLAIELVVLYLSHSFYYQFGFAPLLALGCALIVEGSYTVLSASNGFKYLTLRWLVFLFSAFSLCYASFSSDPSLKNSFNFENSKISQKELELKNLNQDLQVAREEKRTLIEAQKKYFAYDKVTIGLNRVQKPLSEVQSRIKRIKDDIQKNSVIIHKLRNELKDRKIFTWNNFVSLETKTHALIFLMLMLQIISSSFIRSSSKTLKEYLSIKKKYKKKKGALSSFLKLSA